jgi:hypothetical protein
MVTVLDTVGMVVRPQALLSNRRTRRRTGQPEVFLVFTASRPLTASHICIYTFRSQREAVLYKNFTNPCWLVYPQRIKV